MERIGSHFQVKKSTKYRKVTVQMADIIWISPLSMAQSRTSHQIVVFQAGWCCIFFYYTYMRITLIKKYIINTLVNILENLHLNWMILIIWCEKYIYRFFFWRRNFEIFFSKIHQDQNWKYEDHDRNSHSARHGRLDVF